MKESSLDLLLKERSQAFRDKVRALVQRYNIDENDPTFILLAGTSTLEVLLEQSPQNFERLFLQLMAQLDQKWGRLQQEWANAAEKSSTTAAQFTQALGNVQAVAKANQETLRKEAETQTDLLTKVYAEQREELKAEANKLSAFAVAQAQATTAKQVEEAMKDVRKKHYVEAISIACACGAALMLTGWMAAWVSRGRMEDNTYWADIERWNQQELQACVDADLPTCNFHIRMPKEN